MAKKRDFAKLKKSAIPIDLFLCCCYAEKAEKPGSTFVGLSFGNQNIISHADCGRSFGSFPAIRRTERS
jgi:hypothetical protein